jgi:hypothetical protein
MDEQQGTRHRPAQGQQQGRTAPQPRPANPMQSANVVAQVAEVLRGSSGRVPPPKREPGKPEETAPPGGDDADDGQAIDPNTAHAPNVGDEETGAQTGAEGEEQGEGSSDEPLTWERVAEALGVEKAALYEVEFPTGETGSDGTPGKMKLGEIKDAMKRIRGFDDEREQHAERVSSWELESIDARRRIHAIIDAFPPGSIPRAVAQQIEAEHGETVRREAGLLTAARPGWKDPKVSEARKEAIAKAMQKYGFSKAELGSVADHRMVLAMDDFATALDKIDKAKAAARKVPAGDQIRSGNGQAPVNQSQRPGGNRREQLAARVGALIRQRTG